MKKPTANPPEAAALPASFRPFTEREREQVRLLFFGVITELRLGQDDGQARMPAPDSASADGPSSASPRAEGEPPPLPERLDRLLQDMLTLCHRIHRVKEAVESHLPEASLWERFLERKVRARASAQAEALDGMLSAIGIALNGIECQRHLLHTNVADAVVAAWVGEKDGQVRRWETELAAVASAYGVAPGA